MVGIFSRIVGLYIRDVIHLGGVVSRVSIMTTGIRVPKP